MATARPGTASGRSVAGARAQRGSRRESPPPARPWAGAHLGTAAAGHNEKLLTRKGGCATIIEHRGTAKAEPERTAQPKGWAVLFFRCAGQVNHRSTASTPARLAPSRGGGHNPPPLFGHGSAAPRPLSPLHSRAGGRRLRSGCPAHLAALLPAARRTVAEASRASGLRPPPQAAEVLPVRAVLCPLRRPAIYASGAAVRATPAAALQPVPRSGSPSIAPGSRVCGPRRLPSPMLPAPARPLMNGPRGAALDLRRFEQGAPERGRREFLL